MSPPRGLEEVLGLGVWGRVPPGYQQQKQTHSGGKLLQSRPAGPPERIKQRACKQTYKPKYDKPWRKELGIIPPEWSTLVGLADSWHTNKYSGIHQFCMQTTGGGPL